MRYDVWVKSELGKRIASARHEAGTTLAKIGEALGLTEAAVRAYESGRVVPDALQLAIIAQETDKPITYFYDEPSPPASAHLGDLTITGPASAVQSLIATHQVANIDSDSPTPTSRHRGIEALLASLELRATLAITPGEERELRRVSAASSKEFETVDDAIALLRLLRQL